MIYNYLNKNKMKKNLIRITINTLCSMLFISQSFAQAPSTLEWSWTSSSNLTVNGPSTNPVVVTFLKDALNADAGTIFTTNLPALTATVSFRNQQRSSTLTGTTTVLPGLTFGGRNTSSDGAPAGIQAVGSAQVYDAFSTGIPSQLPKNSMYMTSPSATPVAPTDAQGNGDGKGFDAENITGATGPGSADDTNGGVSIYSCVDALHKANEAKDGRFYYGDIVITFNRPVNNPVIHVGGLGGSYNYETAPSSGVRFVTYFTTEMELQNTGLTSVFMAGNPNLNLVGNNILNSALKPNAGSYDNGAETTPGFPDYGAASGSIKLVGTVQEVVYRLYVRGSTSSDFNFSRTKAESPYFNRDPLNGDFWYLSVSLQKPTQEISGTVFIDADGLVDNNVNKTGNTVNNTPTNVAGQLYVYLLNSAGRIVASTPVSSDGKYLFSNVPVLVSGNYSAQLVTILSGDTPLPGTYAVPGPIPPPSSLPDGWVNTGEFVSDVTTQGNDGLVNGKMVIPVLAPDDAKVQNNFGIERAPESVDQSRLIKVPTNGQIYTLSSLSTDSLGMPLPVLQGSDPEDQPVLGTLSTKTIKITSLPFSTGATATLLYGGAPVVLNQIIPNYDPNLLQIRFNSVTFAPGVFQGSTVFNYAYVDAAGVVDPTPASYTLFWQKPVVVSLKSFTATKSNCIATLNWETTSEINADKFEIEMSTLTNNIFNKVGSVPAKGNSTVPVNYQLLFPMESGTVYYFRLKIIDFNGTFNYSDIQIVSCIDKQEITIKPNPTIDIFRISNMEKGKNAVSILSSDSKLIQQFDFTTTSADISLAKYAKGVYIVKIQNENGSIEVKRVVKN